MLPVRYGKRALQGLMQVRERLTQFGSGQKAHGTLVRLAQAVSGLANDHQQWPTVDTNKMPKAEGVKRIVIDGYVALYQVRKPKSGDYVKVLGIYVPRQRRPDV